MILKVCGSFNSGATKKSVLRLIFLWLRHQDSNLEPTPYIYPNVPIGDGLYHHPANCRGKALRPAKRDYSLSR